MNEQYRNAIGSVESDNDYTALGPVTDRGDRAYGRYQVMGANIPEWTKKHLGVEMTPDQFLADQSAQDKVFDGVTSGYHKKYGNIDDVTSSWFSGRPVAQAGNDSDGYNTVPQYLAKVNKAMGGVEAINAAAGIKPASRGALTSAFAADDEDTGALSPTAVHGPGALSPIAATATAEPDKIGTIGRGLTGIGAALAGITSPDQAKALTAQMVAQQKSPTDGGSWSMHVLPNGQMVRINSKTGATQALPGNYAKPEADKYIEKAKEESAKANVELGVNISNAAREAASQATTVDELKRSLSDPNLRQGFGGELQQTARKLYAAFGFGDPATVANGDVASALSNKLALQLVQNGGVKLLPGSFSDSDRKFVQQMSTTLNNSTEANQRLLDIYTRSHEKVQALEDLRAKHEAANNGVIMPSFRKDMAQLETRLLAEDRARASAAPTSTGRSNLPTLPKGVKSIQLIPTP